MEAQALRKILKLGRQPAENFLEWHRRSVRFGRRLLDQLGCGDILKEVLYRHHGWLGHLTRYEMGFETSAAHTWRNSPWWRSYKAQMMRQDPRNRTGWKHHSTGDVPTRWDYLMCDFYGDRWTRLALDKDEWARSAEAFVRASYAKLVPKAVGANE